MLSASRKVAFVLLAALAITATGCGSNNKGKIEGKWKVVSFPEKTSEKNKNDVAEMGKLGIYVYMEFKPEGAFVFGVGAEKQEMLDMMKALAPNQKTTWDAKYKLLSGDGVEIYDLPKDMQKEGSGLFGNKDRARVKVVINGDEMKMTDDDGTATLTKIK
ncbi:MAG: hypothetical protein J0I06_12660 [Planctomycetes bacterium]|nr:hypothetical protein [Planctomycetota bacterium]